MRFVNLTSCSFSSGGKSEDGCAAHADEGSAAPLQRARRLHDLQLMNQRLVHKEEDRTESSSF